MYTCIRNTYKHSAISGPRVNCSIVENGSWSAKYPGYLIMMLWGTILCEKRQSERLETFVCYKSSNEWNFDDIILISYCKNTKETS